MKKLLVIGAGYLQQFIIKKSKEMGYYTYAIDKNPDSVGFQLADEFNVIDITDEDKCLEYAKTMKIDGVITGATDYGVLSTSNIAEKMGLPGLKYEIAKIIKNKFAVRKRLAECNVDDMTQYYEINDIYELNDIGSKIIFPVIVKPCDGSGSMAVKRVDSIIDLEKACEEAMRYSRTRRVLIETFVEGIEFGVESLVYNGEISVLGILGKHMTAPPNYAELGHFFPSNLFSLESKVVKVAKAAIVSLGINFGAVNMDVLITKDEKIYIIDIGARMGGNLIGSHIIPIGTGFDYVGNLIRICMDEPLIISDKYIQKSVATRILALKPGKIIDLPNFDDIENEMGVKLFHQLNVGNTIREYQNNLDGCGYVVACFNDISKAEFMAMKTKLLVDKLIVREYQ